MSHPAFVLANGNLTHDPARPSLCTDEPHVCYGPKVPAPIPSGGGGGGGGGGGPWPVVACDPAGPGLVGFTLDERGIPRRHTMVVCHRPGHYKATIKALVKKIQEDIELSKAGALGYVKSPEKVRVRDLQDLRAQVQALEAEVARLQAKHVDVAALQAEAARYRALVSELEGVLAAARRAVARVAVRHRVAGPAAAGAALVHGAALLGDIEAAVAGAMAQAGPARRLVPLKRDPAGGFWYIVAGVGVYFVAHDVVPKKAWLARAAGYAAAAALGAAGLTRLTGGGK